ncbi:MAG: GNAT family N-acetyltransferase [Parachlamydiaceae bacterium]|nr:GNAT family N-acetyltransferase [Parachlamydiaceae bacterium]
MKKMIEIKQQPLTQDLKSQVDEGFTHHAISIVGHDEKFEPVAFVALEENRMVGIVVGQLFWGALHVKYLFVHDHYRGKGLGSRLMEQVIAYGYANKCPFAFVETMSFQALEFYTKLGFQLELTRFGYAHGTSFHYLRKDLQEKVNG